MKTTALIALLSASAASGFVVPNGSPAPAKTTALQVTPKNIEQLNNAATVAAATTVGILTSSPLAALAEDDSYE